MLLLTSENLSWRYPMRRAERVGANERKIKNKMIDVLSGIATRTGSQRDSSDEVRN